MRFFATAAKGTEGVLRDELRALRLPRVRADRGGVHFEGELAHAMRACLESRVAVRILWELSVFDAGGEQTLYDGVRTIPWEMYITPKHTLAVTATCKSSALTHSHYIALKTKDAVVDRIRDRSGVRPDVNTDRPDVPIVVRVVKDTATVYLDVAGEPLHRRGYRARATDAVMKESLAAAVVLFSGWDRRQPLVDPMCGSGTLVIEAAWMARGIAPGLRRGFAFERWPGFDASARARWKDLRDEASARELPRAPGPILATDADREAVEATRRNTLAAGVSDDIHVDRADARDLRAFASLPGAPGVLVTDPPYGDRLAAQPLQLGGFFRQFGEAMRDLPGWTVAVLSGNPLMERSIPLRPAGEHTLFNGPIECRLLRYLP